MTNLRNKVMMAAAALAFAGVASAQALKADIPFAFQVGNKVMAPGPYLIYTTNSSGVAMFRLLNTEEKQSVLSLPNAKQDPAKEWKADGKPRLGFECAGQCVLAEIWTGSGADVSYRISTPKRHGEAVRTAVVMAQPVKAD
jgi:hypothetical protein